jgi:hypothetical protein
MKTKSDKVYKGMIFAGCSFTWGQGLYYYSNLPTLVEQIDEYTYDNTLVKETHRKFMKSVRFPRLVANHFGTFEMTQLFNSGSHESIISYWKTKLGFQKDPDSNWIRPITPNDISILVFQCTQWHRNRFDMELDGQSYRISCFEAFNEYSELFQRWLDSQNLTLKEWEDYHKQKNIDMVKEFLQEVESHGIKTIIFTWPDENVEYIKRDDWLNERFMFIDYEGNTYNSMEEMMWNRKLVPAVPKDELVIIGDRENFETPPKDHHPSLKCHKVMAENIINYIKNDSRLFYIKKL